MAVRVAHYERGTDDYLTASKWHIDQFGTLHVIKDAEEESAGPGPFGQPTPAGNIASYASGMWETVYRIPDVAGDAIEYLTAIHKLLALGAISQKLAHEVTERTLTLVATASEVEHR